MGIPLWKANDNILDSLFDFGFNIDMLPIGSDVWYTGNTNIWFIMISAISILITYFILKFKN